MSFSNAVETVLPSGRHCYYFEALPSTSTFLRENPHNSQTDYWVLAGRQTAGYGRRGNPWLHEAGNFAGSLKYPWDKHHRHPALASYAVAIGVGEAFEAAGVARADISLKWPNDVLIRGVKSSGILLEWLSEEPTEALSIGIGINLSNAPQQQDFQATALQEILGSKTPTPRQFLPLLDEKVAVWLECYQRDGFYPIRQCWLQQASGMGQAIRVRTPNRELTGIFEDLTAAGELVLTTADGPQHINAGEVFIGPNAGRG